MSEPFYDPSDRPDECSREEFEAAMKIDDGGPAFPFQPKDGSGYPCAEHAPGMALRDYFAAAALQGEIASTAGPESAEATAYAAAQSGLSVETQIARNCYAMADAMLAARKEGA